MKPYYQDDSLTVYNGDCLSVLDQIPEDSIQCCVTSPPYWRQRDYRCIGQLGLEQTPEEYTAAMVRVFSEIRRILKPDGTMFLNLGDKWASGGNGGGGSFMADRGDAWIHAKDAKGWRNPPTGYKHKDLVGIPWMVAFALRSDGWFLRQCNIWAKPNPMPESVSDRSTVSHEYVFHLSKSPDYFYDSESARTPAAPSSETRLAQDLDNQIGSELAHGGTRSSRPMKAVARTDKQRGHTRKHEGFNSRWDSTEKTDQQINGANLRSVWWIAPAQSKENHFAVMPDSLAKICIACACPAGETVVDPFGGSFTTAAVALEMGRKAVTIELNPEYVALGLQRCKSVTPGLAL